MPQTAVPEESRRPRSGGWLWLWLVLSAVALLGACNLHLEALRESMSRGDPPPPTGPWFIQHFAIRPTTFPAGVAVQVVPDNSLTGPGEYLEIANSSASPLYLTILKPPDKSPNGAAFIPAPLGLPIQGIPAFRVISGEVYFWGAISPTMPEEIGWQAVAGTLRLTVEQAYLSLSFDQYSKYLFAKLEPENQLDTRGDRPSNVPIPAPQTTQLSMVYGTNPINVPLTISYELNPNYPPPLHVETLRQEANWLLLLVGAAWLIAFGIPLTRNNMSQQK